MFVRSICCYYLTTVKSRFSFSFCREKLSVFKKKNYADISPTATKLYKSIMLSGILSDL